MTSLFLCKAQLFIFITLSKDLVLPPGGARLLCRIQLFYNTLTQTIILILEFPLSFKRLEVKTGRAGIEKIIQ